MSRFAQGKYNLNKPEKYVGTRSPTYRSSWEWAFMRMCDNNPNIAKWASESVKIPYRNPFTGKYTIYVPDFFIVYNDKKGSTKVELIEVKPANQTYSKKLGASNANKAHYVLNQAKWAAARAYSKQKGIYFRVINEGDIFHQGKPR